MAQTEKTTTFIAFFVALSILTAGVLLHVAGDRAWGSDDAYISYRYAQNLAHGHGLVFNPGERVEGYSNLLYVLAIAPACLLLDLDHIYAYSVALNLFFMALALALFCHHAVRRLTAPWTVAVVILAAASPFVWRCCASGLESALIFLLQIALFTIVSRLTEQPRTKDTLLLTLVITLSVLSRADGFLPPLAAIAYLFLARRWRAALAATATLVITFGAYVAWRLHYYGYPLPNTYYAKVAGPLAVRVSSGFRQWMTLAFTGGWVLYFVALLLPWRKIVHLLSKRDWCIYPAIPFESFYAVLWLAYWHYIGGDFLGMRFLLFLLPLGLFAFARTLQHRITQRRTIIALAAVLVIAQLQPLIRHPHFEYTFHKYDAWMLTGMFLGQEYPGATIAVDAAGKMPYFSELPTIDMLGLNDVHIAHAPVKRMIHAGHTKWDADYILKDRRPDVIVAFVHIDTDLQWGLSHSEYAAAGYELTRAVSLHAPGNGKDPVVDLRSMTTDEKADFLYNDGIRRNRPMVGILERRD